MPADQTVVVPEKSKGVSLQHITQASIEVSFNTELTKNKFQDLKQKVANIEYTEENMPSILNLVTELKKLKTIVETTHKSGKAEYKRVCDLFDLIKRGTDKIIDDIISEPQRRYTELANAQRKRQQEVAIETARVNGIKTGIDNNVMAFSQQIAACKTPADVAIVERKINAEKNKPEKYAEFNADAVARFDKLLTTAAEHKVTLKESKTVDSQLKKAIAKGDEEAIETLSEKQEEIANTISETQINVQESAVDTTSLEVGYAQEVAPEAPKPSRTTWKWKVVDITKTKKQMPEWTELVPVAEPIDQYLEAKKKGATKKKPLEEFEFAGIKFYKEEKFI